MMSRGTVPDGFVPRSPASIERLLDAELSLPSRLGHVLLLLVSLTMAGALGSLWITEPGLPLRTHVGFAVMTAIGLSWAAFSLWVLTHRRTMLVRHEIIAGRMAVTFTAFFAAGAIAMAVTTGGPAFYAGSVVAGVMMAAAAAVLVRARRRFARLVERRAVLERQLRTPK
jgi:hypothetical protein